MQITAQIGADLRTGLNTGLMIINGSRFARADHALGLVQIWGILGVDYGADWVQMSDELRLDTNLIIIRRWQVGQSVHIARAQNGCRF